MNQAEARSMSMFIIYLITCKWQNMYYIMYLQNAVTTKHKPVVRPHDIAHVQKGVPMNN